MKSTREIRHKLTGSCSITFVSTGGEKSFIYLCAVQDIMKCFMWILTQIHESQFGSS